MFDALHSYDIPFVLAGSTIVVSSLLMVIPCRFPSSPIDDVEITVTVTRNSSETRVDVAGKPEEVELTEPVSGKKLGSSVSIASRNGGMKEKFGSSVSIASRSERVKEEQKSLLDEDDR